ncbi:hypothetical protein RSAG8_09642, partial [Rhizoctonia solani AG-8 WAC10335]
MTISQTGDMIRTNHNDRTQLVHYQGSIKRPSRLVRFATRLGLMNGNKPMMDAVAKAYAFVSDNYRQGDQVVLVVNPKYTMDSDLHLNAAEMLAKHLHDGTRPKDLSHIQPSDGGVPPVRIPIHGVALEVSGRVEGIAELNDELKSRFPPGIEHIICWKYGYQSCATRYDMGGGMISREICIAGDSFAYRLWINSTKHVIYFHEDEIPKWDEHKPAWTHELNSSASEAHGIISSTPTRPFGMYRHELRKYECLPGRWGDTSMLVWKSSRGVDEHHP